MAKGRVDGFPVGNQDPRKRGRSKWEPARKSRRGRWLFVLVVLVLIALAVAMAGCTGRDWESLDRKPVAPTPGPGDTRPVVEGAEPASPNQVKFIFTVWDNRGVFFNLGDAGYGATLTMTGTGTTPGEVVEINGVPFAWTVVRVLPFAFSTDVPPEIRTITMAAIIGIPVGWKVRCDIEYGGVPYGTYVEATASGDEQAGITVTEVACTWNG